MYTLQPNNKTRLFVKPGFVLYIKPMPLLKFKQTANHVRIVFIILNNMRSVV